MRTVRYVYGDELKHNNGRVVYPQEWLSELAGAHDSFTCYVVEVCVDCSWNHLVRSYMAGRMHVSGAEHIPAQGAATAPESPEARRELE